ncbi:MAG: translation initiation factor IF-3 [Deltaproteobacteria bacterium]|nr:translation initiation factor IF-3 [Deltaproteobacteria bacterium]
MKELRVNRRIRIPEIRLIDNNGSQLGVVKLEEALKLAQEAELDLVEISPTAKPPVCKIMDYGKYKYLQKKKEHEAKKKQTVVHLKEVKMRPMTDEHDFQFKMRHIQRFLEEGNKAKVTVVFRGRELEYKIHGRTLMDRVLETVKGKATVESPPMMEGRMMVMILAPA